MMSSDDDFQMLSQGSSSSKSDNVTTIKSGSKRKNESDNSSQDSQPDTPTKTRYQFNYFKAKKTKTVGGLKICDLSVKALFEGKLRGRISYMSALEKTKNKGVDVFKFTVFDGADELSGVAYGSVAGKLVNKFLVNSVFDISNFGVSECSWNALHKFEMKLLDSSIIELVEDDNFPNLIFNFISPHAEIANIENGKRIDILGIFVHDWGLQNVGKDEKRAIKRDITIIDTDDPEATNLLVTLWGNLAENFQAEIGDAIVVRNGNLQSFNNVKQVSLSNSLLLVNPDWPTFLDEVQNIKHWFETVNGTEENV